MTEPRCVDCRFFHKLKHNFEVGKGFVESHCCTIMLEHDFEPSVKDITWVQEVDEDSKCEMFTNEDKQKQDAEIKVGDEVKIIGSNPVYDDCDYGVCTYVKKDKIYVMRKDGSASEERKSEWEKTGRTFPEIAEVLKELRGAENDK